MMFMYIRFNLVILFINEIVSPQCEGGMYHPVSQRWFCDSPEKPPERVGGEQRRRSVTGVGSERAWSFLFGSL